MIRQPSAQEQIILERFQADEKYKEQEKTFRKELITRVQIVKYSKSLNNYGNVIINGGMTNEGIQIFYIAGINQPNGVEDFNNFFSQFCVLLDKVINNKQQFILVYLNTGLLTHQNISKFFQQYRILPVEFYTKLDSFYVVHGNFFIKSWFWFQSAIQITILKEKVSYVQNLQQLGNFSFFGLDQYNTLPPYTVSHDTTAQTLKVLCETKWKKEGHHQRSIAVEPIHEVKITGQNLQDFEINEHGIPKAIEVLIAHMTYNKRILLNEGIFRKSPAQSKLKQLETILALQQYNKLDDFDDDIAIAGLIKAIYHQSPQPLFPFKCYPILIGEMKKQNPDIKQFVIQHIQQLPDFFYRNIIFILSFLSRVTEFKEHNKMTAYNMAVVFAPSFLRPEKYSFDSIQDTGFNVKLFQLILENFVDFFPNEKYERYLTIQKFRQRSSSVDHAQNQGQNKDKLIL